MEHCSNCLTGLDNPIYLGVTIVISSPNLTSSSLLHCVHSVMVLLCIPHNRVGVNFNAKSSADSRYGSVTSSSNLFKNPAKLGSTSYVGSGRD